MGLVKILTKESSSNNTESNLHILSENLTKEAIKIKDCFVGGLYIGATVFLEVNPSKLHKSSYNGRVYDRDMTDSPLRKKGIDYLLKYADKDEDNLLAEINRRNSLRKRGLGYLLIHKPEDDNKILKDIIIRESIYISGALLGLSASLIYGACFLINNQYNEIKKNLGIKNK